MKGNDTNLNRFRQQYMAYFQDGIWDIIMGLWLILGGVLILADMIYLAAIWVILLAPIVWAGKRWLILPRLSLAELSAIRPKEVQKLRGVLLVGGLLMLVAGTFVFVTYIAEAAWTIPLRTIWLLIALGTLISILLWIGYRFNALRWYGYAIVLLAGTFILSWLGWTDLPQLLIGVGAVITLGGLVVLFRFLQSHPVLPDRDRPAW